MQVIIGKCGLCLKGNVIRETSLDVEDECDNCKGIRQNYIIDMMIPSPTAKPCNPYDYIDGDGLESKRRLVYENVYDVANY